MYEISLDIVELMFKISTCFHILNVYNLHRNFFYNKAINYLICIFFNEIINAIYYFLQNKSICVVFVGID